MSIYSFYLISCTFQQILCIFHFRANLSHDYFTNRQDRYIVLSECKELADFYSQLVSTVSSFSLQLQPDDTVRVAEGLQVHPYEGKELHAYYCTKFEISIIATFSYLFM